MLLAAVGNSTVWAQTGSDLTPAQADYIVAEHNRVREEAGVIVPIAWDNEMARIAQDWANTLAAWNPLADDVLDEMEGQHIHRNPMRTLDDPGENVSLSWGRDPLVFAIEGWESEKAEYLALPPDRRIVTWENVYDIGHYTQMIWDRTTLVGCGMASNGRNTYVVCNYWSPGNIVGESPITMERLVVVPPVITAPAILYPTNEINVVNNTGFPLTYSFSYSSAGPDPRAATYTLANGESASHALFDGALLYAVEGFGEPILVSKVVQTGRTYYALPMAAQSYGPAGLSEVEYSMSWYEE